jgi:hypothetical protein
MYLGNRRLKNPRLRNRHLETVPPVNLPLANRRPVSPHPISLRLGSRRPVNAHPANRHPVNLLLMVNRSLMNRCPVNPRLVNQHL